MNTAIFHQRIFLILLLVAGHINLFSQKSQRSMEAVAVSTPPKIDGILDDECWKKTTAVSGFVQYDPRNGEPSKFKTEVSVTYDGQALYIGAFLYDSIPSEICTELGERDNVDLNDDYFSLDINPFCDGQNALIFCVSASGVQVDARVTADEMDVQWDAVWQSAVNINDKGWSLEFKIPWTALRFPANSDKAWDVNFFRSQRSTRENSSWNYVDNSNGEMANQMGKLTGIKNINVPVRLSFMPYISLYLNNYPYYTPGINNTSASYNAGMDLKYGLSESFTLDMTLIPDFGQVESDEVILNLTPFEIKYDEKRQFFNEGTELFSKAGLFYSRRIGDIPNNYYSVEDNTDSTKTIMENPSMTQLINATKISGRTSNGTGLGLFNAITANTYATIQDSAGNKDKVLTQPLTNYNILVYDQPLAKNSYVSLINTNVYYDRYGNMANVSGTEFKIADKNNMWAIQGLGAVSLKFDSSNANSEPGHKYALAVGKISGNFKFYLANSQLSNTFDPNDMGYIEANNDMLNEAQFEYNFYDPFWKFISLYNSIYFVQKYRYTPRTKTEFGIQGSSTATFSNYTTVVLDAYYQPFEMYDYYEPRVDGRFLTRSSNWYSMLWFSTDYRKRFAIDAYAGYLEAKGEFKDSFWWGLEPRFRISNRFSVNHEFAHDNEWRDVGFVAADSIIHMGQRDNRRITNTLSLNYIFSKDIGLSMKVRHFWITVKYKQFFALQNDGGILTENIPNIYDESFNAFNVDLVFNWHFAPGSNLSIVWKNAILTDDAQTDIDFTKNFSNTLASDQLNSFSVKLLYYLDYMYLKKKK
jgi:hypothetical protein